MFDTVGEQAPWEKMEALLLSDDRTLITNYLEGLPPIELARAVSNLDVDDQVRLLELLGPEKSALTVAKISGLGASTIIGQLDAEQAAAIVEAMPHQQKVQLLRNLRKSDANNILSELRPGKDRRKLHRLISYPQDTAGALMISEYLSFRADQTVREVLDDLRQYGEEYSDYDIQYAYVVTDTGFLTGVLRLRDLLMSERSKLISEIMIQKPLKVNTRTSLRDLKDFFRQHPLIGVPVTDEEGALVGVVRSATIRDAVNRQSNQLFLKFAGIVGGEESRTMPLYKRSTRRLSWLSLNILLNVVAFQLLWIGR